jgi:hypothetical protein
MIAAKYGHEMVVRQLLDAVLSMLNNDGKTPLQLARDIGFKHVASLLVAAAKEQKEQKRKEKKKKNGGLSKRVFKRVSSTLKRS